MARTWWDHGRALLIVAHVVAITAVSIPVPGSDLSDRNRANPTVQRTLEPWAQLVVSVGLARDVEGGIDWLWAAGGVYSRLHRRATAPVRPWIRFTGHKQQWGMFGYSPASGGELELDALTLAGEVALYRRAGPSWGWPVLAHHRVRRLAYDWSQGRKRYKLQALTRWLARRDDRYPVLRARLRQVRVPPGPRLRTGGLVRGEVVWEAASSEGP